MTSEKSYVSLLNERKGAMDLKRSVWYVRWYFWSRGICDQFLDEGNSAWKVEQNGTNLCAFVRMIFIYAPLVLLLNAITFAFVLATITVLPVYLFGWKGYGLGVGAIAATVFLIYAIVFSVARLRKRREAKRSVQKQATKPIRANVTNPSFARVMGRWVMAKKRKICPLITFVKSDKEVQS